MGTSSLNKDLVALTTLQDALFGCLDQLDPTDYVCFNFGNTHIKLFNDYQFNMNEW